MSRVAFEQISLSKQDSFAHEEIAGREREKDRAISECPGHMLIVLLLLSLSAEFLKTDRGHLFLDFE